MSEQHPIPGPADGPAHGPAHGLAQAPADRRVKVGHLVTGLVFLGLAGTWALRAGGTLGDLEIAVVVPVVLVAAGVIGLIALMVGNRRTGRRVRGLETRLRPSSTAGEPLRPSPTADLTPDPTEETAPITGVPLDHEPTTELDPHPEETR